MAQAQYLNGSHLVSVIAYKLGFVIPKMLRPPTVLCYIHYVFFIKQDIGKQYTTIVTFAKK
jgi:hypothetical protein